MIGFEWYIFIRFLNGIIKGSFVRMVSCRFLDIDRGKDFRFIAIYVKIY